MQNTKYKIWNGIRLSIKMTSERSVLCLRQNVASPRLFSPLPVRNHMERRIPIRRLINAAGALKALAAEVGEDAGGGGGGGGRCAEALADEVVALELGLARRTAGEDVNQGGGGGRRCAFME